MNDTLAMTQFINGYWNNLTTEMTQNISTATDSRYLSMTKIFNLSSFEVCLFYEDLNGKVNAVRGLWTLVPVNDPDIEPTNVTVLPPSASTASSARSDLSDSLDPLKSGLLVPVAKLSVFKWTWEDNTRKLRAALPNNNFSAPFSSSASADGGVLAMFSNLTDDDTYGLNAFMTDYVKGTFKAGTLKTISFMASGNLIFHCVARTPDWQLIDQIDRSTAPFDLLQISPTQGSDPLLFWINGTKLEIHLVNSSLNITRYPPPFPQRPARRQDFHIPD